MLLSLSSYWQEEDIRVMQNVVFNMCFLVSLKISLRKLRDEKADHFRIEDTEVLC